MGLGAIKQRTIICTRKKNYKKASPAIFFTKNYQKNEKNLFLRKKSQKTRKSLKKREKASPTTFLRENLPP